MECCVLRNASAVVLSEGYGDHRELHVLTHALPTRRVSDLLGDWGREGEEIHKVFEFYDFKGAIGFVNEVARLADRYDHHPDIDIRWNKVRLSLKIGREHV